MSATLFAREHHHRDPESDQESRYYSFTAAARAACTGCGQCCRSWGISIEEDRADRVEAYFRSRGFFPPEQRLFQHVKRGQEGQQVEETHIVLDPQTAVCPFLTEDNKCLIHKHLGYEAKGTTCQVFPRQPLYVPGLGGFDALFFSSNYTLDLLFSDKPLDMLSIGEGLDAKAHQTPLVGSALTPADLAAMLRAYSHFFQHEKSHWRLAGVLVFYLLFAEQEAQAGRPPRDWNSARAETHLKTLTKELEAMPFQASMQLQILRLIVNDAIVEMGGGGDALITPTILKLYTGPDGQLRDEPNLIAYNRLVKQFWPVLEPVMDVYYRRFIAFKNYGLTFIAMNGLVNGPWFLLFHLALTRLLALSQMQDTPDIPPELALRKAIFVMERDFIHNAVRVKTLCEGKLHDLLKNHAMAAILARPR